MGRHLQALLRWNLGRFVEPLRLACPLAVDSTVNDSGSPTPTPGARMQRIKVWILATVATLCACGQSTQVSSRPNGKYPTLTPAVKSATPQGFQVHTAGFFSLDAADFRSRFFESGPTNLFSILQDVDGRIEDINQQTSKRTSACTSQAAVPYTVTAPGGDVTLFAQCYESLSTPNGQAGAFVQWGTQDGVFYIYSAIGAEHLAAVATPLQVATGAANSGTAIDPNQYSIQLWFGVGYDNAAGCGSSSTWDGCSYGVAEVLANPNTVSFEMSVAGVGFGYCGAQYKSDGVNLYGAGSSDMGSTCNTTDTLCVSASDGTTPATCSAAQRAFTLPGLGRQQAVASPATVNTSGVWAASAYPGGSANTVVLNGTSTDSLALGPTRPTSGVGAL